MTAKQTSSGNPTFSSTAFPTDEDMKRWHSLSPAEQEAALLADLKEGLDGPSATRQGKDEIIKVALAADADAV
ncbi:MAG: hypothetical protein AAF225_00190 [Pseudomonadota bacterium]